MSRHAKKRQNLKQFPYIPHARPPAHENPPSHQYQTKQSNPTPFTPVPRTPVPPPHPELHCSIPKTQFPFQKVASNNYLTTVANVLGTSPTLALMQFNTHTHINKALQLVTGAGLEVVVVGTGAIVVLGTGAVVVVGGLVVLVIEEDDEDNKVVNGTPAVVLVTVAEFPGSPRLRLTHATPTQLAEGVAELLPVLLVEPEVLPSTTLVLTPTLTQATPLQLGVAEELATPAVD